MNIKLLPYNIRGTVAIASVTPTSVTPGTRAQAPLPPGNVKVNAVSWPLGTHFTAATDVVLTWAHRFRTVGVAVVQQDAGNQAAAPEGTYTVEVLHGATVKRTVTGLTGTTWTYTAAMQATDGVTSATVVSLRITPVNGTYTGKARQTDTFFIG